MGEKNPAPIILLLFLTALGGLVLERMLLAVVASNRAVDLLDLDHYPWFDLPAKPEKTIQKRFVTLLKARSVEQTGCCKEGQD
jgi:hypothetical protein